MAWSNVKREPRREITEQVLGVIAAVAFFVGDYYAVCWLKIYRPDLIANGADFVFAAFMLPMTVMIGSVVCWLAWHATHALGEWVCDLLGPLDPRPRRRY